MALFGEAREPSVEKVGPYEEVTVEKWDPLGAIDFIFEDVLGLPSPFEVLPKPATIIKSITGTTLADLFHELKDKALEDVERKLRKL